MERPAFGGVWGACDPPQPCPCGRGHGPQQVAQGCCAWVVPLGVSGGGLGVALSYWVSPLLLSLCHQVHLEPGSGAGTLRITPQGQCRRGRTDTFSCPRLCSAGPDLTVTHDTQPVLWGPEEQPGHWDGALLRQVKGEEETKGPKGPHRPLSSS